MDPQATLKNLIDAVLMGDREFAHDAVDDLVDWIDKDGFVPDLFVVIEKLHGVSGVASIRMLA